MTAQARNHEGAYLPAMGRDWLLPLYDPLCRLLRMAALHRPLVEQAAVQPGHRVLEIGCGTGNLAIMAAVSHPDAEITGLDPDREALARAGRKAARRGARVRFDQGFAERLPYPDGSFERVLSSFMFHHLEAEVKIATLREARRVLSPVGSFHLLDAGGNIVAADGWMARKALHNPHLRDNLGDRIPTLLREAGFTDAREVTHRTTRVVGRVTYVHATNT